MNAKCWTQTNMWALWNLYNFSMYFLTVAHLISTILKCFVLRQIRCSYLSTRSVQCCHLSTLTNAASFQLHFKLVEARPHYFVCVLLQYNNKTVKRTKQRTDNNNATNLHHNTATHIALESNTRPPLRTLFCTAVRLLYLLVHYKARVWFDASEMFRNGVAKKLRLPIVLNIVVVVHARFARFFGNSQSPKVSSFWIRR